MKETHTHTYIDIHVNIYVYMYTCIYIYILTCAYIFIYRVRIYIYICIHVWHTCIFTKMVKKSPGATLAAPRGDQGPRRRKNHQGVNAKKIPCPKNKDCCYPYGKLDGSLDELESLCPKISYSTVLWYR